MRILTVFGTRPEVIKLAPVIRALQRRNVDVLLCASGQHRDLLDQMLAVFSLRPDFDLDVMQSNQSPLDVSRRIVSELSPVIERTHPDWLVVQGDTTTVFAASWVGFHWRVPIGHVEAGLRTRDKFQPFPEEMNRRLTSVLADIHFAPTPLAAQNLLAEGVDATRIFITGNPVVDAVEEILSSPIAWKDSRLGGIKGRVILVTVHRRENFGHPMEEICRAISGLLAAHSDLTAVLPVHPNPCVQEVVTRLLGGVPRMILTGPLSYPDFIHLMRRSEIILSDSGGVQEEAPSVRTPVLVLREVTERPEAIESEWACLVGPRYSCIFETATAWLAQEKKNQLAHCPNPFGVGHSGERIAELLIENEKRQPHAKVTKAAPDSG